MGAFDQASLAQAVANVLATDKAITPDHRGAFLARADDTGVTVIVAERLAGPWTVTGYYTRPWHPGETPQSFGATVQAAW